ncbi:MAG TPA: hypothetical protein VJ486_03475 [Geothrix sp.]|nr:hypothetical protein [Geothrix sp.]
MEYTKHISIMEEDGHAVITVDDWELFDYLDDFFVDQHLDCTLVSTGTGQNGAELHSLHFAPSITPQALLLLLSRIPVAEIERVHALNEPRK